MSFRKSWSESVVMSGFRSRAVFWRLRPRLPSAGSAAAAAAWAGIRVVDHLDALTLEVAVELLDVALVDLYLGERLGDLPVGDDPLCLSLGEEGLDLLELLEFRD